MHDTSFPSPDRPQAPAGASTGDGRRGWSAPELAELPRLVKLTLQTGGAGGGAGVPVGATEGGGLVF
ncbi:MAG TPA: hypothetical protein VKA84_24935 [Gemmatimonadaceae bacterium]|nr:hypothetical protein [Gemmatimonadaceae bacterium]